MSKPAFNIESVLEVASGIRGNIQANQFDMEKAVENSSKTISEIESDFNAASNAFETENTEDQDGDGIPDKAEAGISANANNVKTESVTEASANNSGTELPDEEETARLIEEFVPEDKDNDSSHNKIEDDINAESTEVSAPKVSPVTEIPKIRKSTETPSRYTVKSDLLTVPGSEDDDYEPIF